MWFATVLNLDSDDDEAGGRGGSVGSESSLSLSVKETPLLRGFSTADESPLEKGSETSIREDGCTAVVASQESQHVKLK